MDAYYLWFIIFSCLAFLIVTDPSVAKAVDLLSRLAKSRYQIFVWWLRNNPSNPIVKYMIWRRSMKLAEELRKEFEEKKNV